MNNTRHNRLASRLLIVLVSALAGFGIWTAVAQTPQQSSLSTAPAVSASAPVKNPNFGINDTFLVQPYVQSAPVSGQQTSPAQSVPRPRLRTRGS